MTNIYEVINTVRNLEKYKINPLYSAISMNDLDRLYYEYNRDKKLLNMLDNNGYTPLRLCVKLKNMEYMNILIEMGADLYMKYKDGKNILHLSIMDNNIEATNYIINIAPDLLLRTDDKNRTPGHMVNSTDQHFVITKMCEYTYPIDTMDSNGSTILYNCVSHNINIYIINKLLDSGANPYTIVNGTSVLMAAIENNNYYMIYTLLRHMNIDDEYIDILEGSYSESRCLDYIKEYVDNKKQLIKEVNDIKNYFEMNKEIIKENIIEKRINKIYDDVAYYSDSE